MLKIVETMSLTSVLGAAMSGIQFADLVKRDDSSNAEQLFQMMVGNKVLVFRDQHFGPQIHVDVAKLIGDLATPLLMHPKVAGHGDIIIIRNDDIYPPENEV